MNARAFKSGLERALLAVGFATEHGLLVRHETTAWTLVDFDKKFGNDWSVNVGFHLNALGGERPDRLEKSHLYFRLERLFPAFHEVIATAGALDEQAQTPAYRELVDAIAHTIDPELRRLGTEAGLRSALAEGRLVHGLVRKEVRAYLSK